MRASPFLVLAFCVAPSVASAQLYETGFDDIADWTAAWDGDPWSVVRGQASPVTDSTCLSVHGPAYVDDPGCGFGAPLEPQDNVLHTGDLGWDDVRVTARFTNFDDDAVGFVVRYADADNYYLLLMARGTWPSAGQPSRDMSGPTTRLYRVRNGRSTLLASSPVTFTAGAAHLIRVDAVRDRVTVYLDQDFDGLIRREERVFSVGDDAPLAAGRVGLWAYDNKNVFFDWLRVFEVNPPPEPGDFRVLSIDRAGRNVRYAFNFDTPAQGYLVTAEGRCAEVDPAVPQAPAGVGTKIVGSMSTDPDTDYCVRACSQNAEGVLCGEEIDFSTRGAVVDTSDLSPGHYDLLTRDLVEHLGTHPAGGRTATTARMGQYTMRFGSRTLDFDVDQNGLARLVGDDLDGRARSLDGAVVVIGLPLVLDMSRQRRDAVSALFAADYQAGFGSRNGNGTTAYRLLPGDYRWRVRGRDYGFTLGADGSVALAPGAAGHVEANGARLVATATLGGEAVAFRLTLSNQGPAPLNGAGAVNGRVLRAGDDVRYAAPALYEYALADARGAHFRDVAGALGYRMDGHAWWGFGSVAAGTSGQLDVVLYPTHPELEVIADVGGAFDRVVTTADPFTAILFDEAGEPTEGQIPLHEVDVARTTRDGLRSRFAGETGQAYGTVSWEVLARAATPGEVTVHWMNAAGDRARVSFTTNRQANGAIAFTEAPCDEVDWAEFREQGMGVGVSFQGDLVVEPEREYCIRAQATNAAGRQWGPPTSLSTRQISVDLSKTRGPVRVQQPGPNLLQIVDSGDTYDDLGLRMGEVVFDQGGVLVTLEIDKDGNVSYDDGLEGILQGAGGRELVVNGIPLHVDATELTGEAALYASEGAAQLSLGPVSGGGAADMRVLPGRFGLVHGERHAFDLALDGTVTPVNAAALTGGAGEVTTRGRAVDLDLLPVPGDVSVAAAGGQPTHAVLQGAGVREAKLLPGRYTLEIAGARSSFTVGEDDEPTFEAIDAELGFASCIDHGEVARGEGAGTDTLVVRADPCSITAEVICEESCGVEDDVFQAIEGRGEARGTVRYASGQPVRPNEEHGVSFEVNGGALSDMAANTVEGVARVGYSAPDQRGDYLLRVRSGGLTSTAPFVVIPVRDVRAPVIVPGPAVRVEQANADGTEVRLDAPTVTDNVDPAPTVTNDAPRVFPLGRTVVTWRAIDFSGNAAQAVQEVVVVDTTAPTLRAPAEVELEATSPAGTPVDIEGVQVHDICDARPDLVRDGPRRFAVGETLVTWTASDDSGNESQAQTLVRITDTTPPSILFPEDEVVIEATHGFGARGVDLPRPVVRDNGDANPVVEYDAPGELPFGRTLVTWFATDASGNRASARIPVVVRDATAPELNIAGVPDGWTDRAELRITVFDVVDVQPDIDVLPPPDVQDRQGGVLTAVYDSEGVHEVAVTASDAAGNVTQRALRAFGVDATAPRLRISTTIPDADGVDPADEATWPVVFGSELLDLRVDVTDAPALGVSGIARVTMTLDPDSAQPRVLVDAVPDPAGVAPVTGPPAVRGIVCDRAGLCDAEGRIRAERIGDGGHVVAIEVTDHAGNVAVERRYLRTFTLRAALEAAADQLDDIAGGPGIADQGVAALNEASVTLRAAASIADGQPAGVDAPVDLTGTILRHVQAAGPAIGRAERFGVDAGAAVRLYGRAMLWAVGSFGQVGFDPELGNEDDYAEAEAIFGDARDALLAGEIDAAMSDLGAAYFLFENGLRPLTAGAFGDAVRTTVAVRDQIDAYLEVPGRPGAGVLAGTLADLDTVAGDLEDFLAQAGEFEDEDEQVMALANVDAHQYLLTLVALQRLARAMQGASAEDVWIRNWSWGLVQTTMLLSRLGALRSRVAEPVFTPEDIALLDEADALVAEGQDLVDARRTDAFFELFLAGRTECVVILVYNRAFMPLVDVPEGCE